MKPQKPEHFTVVHTYVQTALTAPLDSLADAIRPFFADDFECHAFAPVHQCHTVDDIGEKFWKPIRQAFTNLQRITSIDIDGKCAFNGNLWVTATGIYQGQFTAPLYTIPATQTLNHIRFSDFYHIENGKIKTAYKLMDYMGVMIRSNVNPLPPSLGSDADMIFPHTQDGLLYGNADPKQTQDTQHLIWDMLSDLMHTKQVQNKTQKSVWADDMIWHGPSGIGTFYGLDGFSVYRNAFLNSFPDRDYGYDEAVISKNNFSSLVGWKSVIATHQGSGWLGLAPTGKVIHMRLSDFYCVVNGQIKQNWVLIDLIHVFEQLGIDLFDMVDKIYNKTLFEIPDVPRKNHANSPQDIAFKNKLLQTEQ